MGTSWNTHRQLTAKLKIMKIIKTGESDQIFVCFIQVTSVSMATVLQQQPYQLFYELSKGNQTSDTYIVVPI